MFQTFTWTDWRNHENLSASLLRFEPSTSQIKSEMLLLKPVDLINIFNGAVFLLLCVSIRSCSVQCLSSLLQLSAVIPPGFCVTVVALEIQMQEISQLQDALTALQHVSSTSTELDVIQEQCNKWVTVVLFVALISAVLLMTCPHHSLSVPAPWTVYVF